MVNIVTYPYSQYTDAATYLAAGIDALGCFDSVTESSGIITCTKDGSTVATVTLTGGGRIDVVFGNYTTTANSGMAYWIGLTPNGVFIDGKAANDIFTYSIYKSKTGDPMFTYHATWGNIIGNVNVALDTISPTVSSNPTIQSSLYYTVATALCAAPGSETSVSISDKAYCITTRQSNILTTSIQLVSIGGVEYMTDGYLLIETQ